MKQPRLPKGAKLIGQGEGVQVYDLPPDPRRRYPTWRIDALEADIRMLEGKIESFEATIQELFKTITERREQIKLCEERDRAIAEWERQRADSDFPSGNEDHSSPKP